MEHAIAGTPSANPAPYRTLTLDVVDGLARLRLDRPAQRNAIDACMAADLARATAALAADRSVRAVLLSGNGPTFSAGGDIGDFVEAGSGLPDRLHAMIDDFHLAVERLAALDVPVVAAVTGACAGGGLGLVCAADVVVAAPDAVFAAGYPALGLTADGGSTWFLPRLIGQRRTRELFLTGRRVGAPEAREWGLVTTVADDAPAEAERVAATLATGPTRAFAAVRDLLRHSSQATLHDQLAAEQRSVVDAARTDDAREGVAAFAARRPPLFRGR
ncbi:enoyl-CoA hydratase/isomerase family protein [Pseudonocardia endophytica]|uniref:2-(1,2-epoxy-1,2-dihydrophenyl)acetyl-CoA isomerase n=1 Tax=Pseudonocardia endophytica TaxID=401976 RepID=A0A4V2PIH0_PSEEN|nr:enoyl-CoA hydratase-related protein [Pseudonocardia endophytica]TCK24536.1 2-(1,2-epoxy-1,2-dihydrophenyl)acetyl-CoA isomerase [Pseudonocardia endophytica]